MGRACANHAPQTHHVGQFARACRELQGALEAPVEDSMISNVRNVFRGAMVLTTVVAAAGCSMQVGEATGSQEQAFSAPTVPPALVVPEGNQLAFHLDAIGVQIYGCQAA